MHLGRDDTVDLVLMSFWQPSAYRGVLDSVLQYGVCQRKKTPDQKGAGTLQPLLSMPERAWESTIMDLITQLPESCRGHTAIAKFVH